MCEVGKLQIVVQKAEEPVVKTLSLAVAGATNISGHQWKADFDTTGGKKIVITATTNDGDVEWTCEPGTITKTETATSLTIPLDNQANILAAGTVLKVTAKTANVTDTPAETFLIRPVLQKLDVVTNHYAFESTAGTWYALNLNGIAAGITAQLQATVAPATDAALSHLEWQAVDTANGDATVPLLAVAKTGGTDLSQMAFALDSVATVKTSVRLKSDADWSAAKSQTIDVKAPATAATVANGLQVELAGFTYDGAGYYAVTQENKTNFNKDYAAAWTPGQTKLPQAYTADTTMALKTVSAEILAKATKSTTLMMRVSAYFPTKNSGLVVLSKTSTESGAVDASNAVGTTIAINDLTLDGDATNKKVPNEVMHLKPLLIFWEVSGDKGTTWAPLRLTNNTVYVTAQAPAASADKTLNRGGKKTNPVYSYDSFLAISCTAAAGEAGGAGNKEGVRAKIAGAFGPLPLNSQNNGMKLLYRDQLLPPSGPLTYWKSGCKPAQSVNGNAKIIDGGNVFNNPNACVACGAWADMLIYMWALHGINDGHFTSVVTEGYDRNGSPPQPAFMVRKWGFKGDGYFSDTAENFNVVTKPISGSEVDKTAWPDDRAPSQNNASSPNAFHNHFIVNVVQGSDNILYDPSYGTITQPSSSGADDTGERWRNAAVNGRTTNKKAGWATKSLGVVTPAANVVTITDFITSKTIS